MIPSMPSFDEGLPWEEEVLDVPDLPDCIAPASGEYGDPLENSIDISTLSRLLDPDGDGYPAYGGRTCQD